MMQKHCWSARAGAPVALICLLAVGVGVAATTSATTIGLDPYGDAVPGANGAPTALSPGAFLVSATGADGAVGTDDDATLLITRLGDTLTTTALATPRLGTDAGPPTRLSATRACIVTAGPDGTWGTVDDEAVDLDRLGSSNTVDALTVGRLGDHAAYRPVRITADSFIALTTGADGVQGNADDTLALVTDLEGGAPVVRSLAAPHLPLSLRSRPVALTTDAVLTASAGADGAAGTADDVVYLFTGLGSTNTRTDLPVPYMLPDASGRPLRVSLTRALVAAAGADGTPMTADDAVVLLDELGIANTSTTIVTGALPPGGAGAPTALAYDRAVVASAGPDAALGTADDVLVSIAGLGPTAVVTGQTVGGLGAGPASRPVKLSRRSCALVAAGVDLAFGTADDELVVATGLGLDDTLGRQVVPGLSPQMGCRPVRLSAESVLLANGGADATLGTADDEIALVSGFAGIGHGGESTVASFPAAGAFDGGALSVYLPRLLGGGRAVLTATGPDLLLGQGGDDCVQVLEGVPEGRALSLRKFRLRYRARRPDRPARIRVKAHMPFEDPEDLAESTLTISLGNASQTIPGSALRFTRRGDVKYRDRRGRSGFIRKLWWKKKNGNVLIEGKGVQTGVESTAPGYVPVAVDGEGFCVGHCVAGTDPKSGAGVKYREPKRSGGNEGPGPGSTDDSPGGGPPTDDPPGPHTSIEGPDAEPELNRDGPQSDDADEPQRSGPDAGDDPPQPGGPNENPQEGPADDAPGSAKGRD